MSRYYFSVPACRGGATRGLPGTVGGNMADTRLYLFKNFSMSFAEYPTGGLLLNLDNAKGI